MKTIKEKIQTFVKRMQSNDHFSMVGYSDAEWFCMFPAEGRAGQETGLGQIIDPTHGVRLLDVIHRRQNDPSFLFAVPSCMWVWPHFEDFDDAFFEKHNIRIEPFERDTLTDGLAEHAGLYPFINQLRQMPVVVIGNKHLRGLDFLDYKHFVEISCPNLHMEAGAIEMAVTDAQQYGQPAAYLVSAGVSAAVIIDELHGTIPDSWFIDCGSIWDAFVGIGAQREWREKLYKSPELFEMWKWKNLNGTRKRKR